MPIKNIADIETSFGMKAGQFKEFMDSKDEIEIDLTKLSIVPKADYEVLKKDEFETRIKNIEKSKYDEGKTVGSEMTMKEFKTVFDLDVSKKIPIADMKTAIENKIVEAHKIEPEKRYKTLQGDFEAMKKNFEDSQNETKAEKETRLALEKTYKQKENDSFVETSIMTKLPKVKTVIEPEEMAIIFKRKFNPKLNDAGAIELYDGAGTLLKNTKTLSPMTIDEVMPDFQTKYIAPAEGGGGGGDNPKPPKGGSFEAFVEEMGKAGINQGSQKFNEEVSLRIKNKTLVM